MKFKTKLCALCAVICALCATGARADVVDFYMGGGIGAGTVYSDTVNRFSTTSYAAALGIDAPIIRAEAEYNYIAGSRAGNSFNKNIGMLNGYVKVLPTPIIKPYIGAGVGYMFGGRISGRLNSTLRSDPAYAGMAGVQIKIPFIGIYVDVEGRVMYAPDAFPNRANMIMPEARIKLRYIF
ncbi:MAG: porin family protein [Proteobacteria bacterium]|nr:porin family protein [Pseudomonadota bacterium]